LYFRKEEHPMSKRSKEDELLLSCLPRNAREFATNINQATHSPIPLIITALLTTNSASLGGGSSVSLNDWDICPNLYGISVAASGIGKSSALKPILEPLNGIQQLYREDWKKQQVKYMSELEIVNTQINQAKKEIRKSLSSVDSEIAKTHEMLISRKAKLEDLTSRFSEPLLTINDFTEEALAVCASKQPFSSLFLVSAEGRNIMNIIWGRYAGNGSTSETFLIMSYSGDPHSVTRLGREGFTTQARIAFYIAVQDDVFDSALDSATFTQSGLFPRCLMTRHSERIGLNPKRQAIKDTSKAWWQQHVESNYDYFRSKDSNKSFILSRKATYLLEESERSILSTVDETSKVHGSYTARYFENLIKVTINLHSLAYSDKAIKKPINSKTVSYAVKLMDFYRSEQIKILHTSEQRSDVSLKKRLIDLLTEHDDEMTLRDLKRKHSISHSECERIAGKFPDEFEIISRSAGEKGGRPSKVIILIG
jgi:hypothetical protein